MAKFTVPLHKQPPIKERNSLGHSIRDQASVKQDKRYNNIALKNPLSRSTNKIITAIRQNGGKVVLWVSKQIIYRWVSTLN